MRKYLATSFFILIISMNSITFVHAEHNRSALVFENIRNGKKTSISKKNSNATTHILQGELLMIYANVKKNRYSDKEIYAKLSYPNGELLVHVPFLHYKPDLLYALLPVPLEAKLGLAVVSLVYVGIDSEKISETTTSTNRDVYDKLNNTNRNSVVSSQHSPLETFTITIGKKHLFIEKVVLNNRLAKKKSTPANPKTVAEAKEIWKTTGNINPLNTFELFNFIFPLKEYRRISGMFGDQRNYTYSDGKTITGSSHGGVDIVAPKGTSVYVSGAGRVVLAKSRIVTGNSVVIEHFPGVYTMYYHLDSILVSVGDFVGKGMQIGTLGNTGFSTGAHLHWEMRVNNIRIDPWSSLERLDKIKTLTIR